MTRLAKALLIGLVAFWSCYQNPTSLFLAQAAELSFDMMQSSKRVAVFCCDGDEDRGAGVLEQGNGVFCKSGKLSCTKRGNIRVATYKDSRVFGRLWEWNSFNYIVRVANENADVVSDVIGWGLPNIMEYKIDRHHFVVKKDFTLFDGDIRPQLALGSFFGEFDSILSSFSGVFSGFDEFFGVLSGRLHFLELAVDYPIADSREENQKTGEISDARRPLRHPALIPLVVGFSLLFLCLCSGLAAVKGSEYAEDHGLPW
jgi:hypothetical protein